MTELILLFIGFCALIVTIVAVCTVMHDVRLIRAERAHRRHPHAARWRARPPIMIVTDGQPTNDCLASIRKVTYRKKRIVTNSLVVPTGLVLRLSGDSILARNALAIAAWQHAAWPRRRMIELLPHIGFPHSLAELHRNYRIILDSRFLAVRSVTNTVITDPPYPVLYQTEARHRAHNALAFVAKLLFHTAHASILLAALFFALSSYQSLLFVLYLGALLLWIIWSLADYPTQNFLTKIAYLFLLPAVLPYLAYRLLSAPARISMSAIRAALAANHRQANAAN